MHKDEPETETEGKEPTSVSGEEKKAAGDNDSTVENNIEFSLPKPVKTTKTPNNSDEKEAIAKAADNEPTTTTTEPPTTTTTEPPTTTTTEPPTTTTTEHPIGRSNIYLYNYCLP